MKTLGQLLASGDGHLFCSTEDFQPCPDIYNAARVETVISPPGNAEHSTVLEYSTEHVRSDTLRMELDHGAKLSVIARFRRMEGSTLYFQPLVMGAPWMSHDDERIADWATWHGFNHFENFIEDFDEFEKVPKKWKRMVYESLSNCKEIERARIEEALRRIDDRMVPRQANAWDANLDWLENAELEHDARPFRAIIAEENVRRHSAVIVGVALDDTVDFDGLSESDSLRLWQADRSKIISRTATEMADAIEMFIKSAEVIYFVDKYFGPENPRHRIPFEEFISRLTERAAASMPKTVAVHCSSRAEVNFFKSQCENRLAAKVPTDLRVQFHRWDGDDLHNRFVVTELGGVAFLEGLDQYDGKGRREDVVVLLDRSVARQLIANYTPGTSSYRHIDECEIVGTCRR